MVDLLRDIMGRWGATAALVQVLLQHPAAAAIDAGVAGKLLAECPGSSNSAAVMAVLLQLPAAQELSAQQVSALVHQALHRHDSQCCKLLSTHPAAASGGDPELHLLLEVLQPQGFSTGYLQHRPANCAAALAAQSWLLLELRVQTESWCLGVVLLGLQNRTAHSNLYGMRLWTHGVLNRQVRLTCNA